MDNTTRLLDRHAPELATRRWALVEAEDPASLALPGLVYSHADKALANALHVAMLPELPEDVDLLVLVLPKSGERLSMLLASLAGQIGKATEVWLVGPTRGGIKGGMTRLERYATGLRVIDSARHCKLVSAVLEPAPFTLDDWTSTFPVALDASKPVAVTSFPGVFNHGALDEGTAMLLDVLQRARLSGAVLDMGCGAGVISALLAQAGCLVTAVDVSATAVFASERTLRSNHLAGDVFQGNLFDALPDGRRFAHIVTNPPFHDGSERTLAITRRLIAGAPARLQGEGSLWLVANQGLAYRDWLDESFARVSVVTENRRFRVYRATR